MRSSNSLFCIVLPLGITATACLGITPACAELLVREIISDAALSVDGFGSVTNSGFIQADIPSGSTIKLAYLYAASVWNQSPVFGLTFNGHELPVSAGTVLGPDSNPATTVRWDVTNIITSSFLTGGLQTYSIVEAGQNDGAALIVAYSNSSTQGFTSLIIDGELSTQGDAFRLDFDKPYTGGNFFISLASSFSRQPASGQQQYTLIDVTTDSTMSRRLTASAGGADDRTSGENSGNGNLITVGGLGDNPANVNPTVRPQGTNPDDEFYNLALGNAINPDPFILPGDTFIVLDTINPSDDDNVFGMFISSSFVIVPEPPSTCLLAVGCIFLVLRGFQWQGSRGLSSSLPQ